MAYKPLSDQRHHPISQAGTASQAGPATEVELDVEDLPGSTFFSGRRDGDRLDGLCSVFYKDQAAATRRVLFDKAGGFRFSPVIEPRQFITFGEVLFVPDMDPRAWTAARDTTAGPVSEMPKLEPGTVFSALSMSESLSSNRRGVYSVGDDRLTRRLLKPAGQGLSWSSPIPVAKLAAFGEVLSVRKD